MVVVNNRFRIFDHFLMYYCFFLLMYLFFSIALFIYLFSMYIVAVKHFYILCLYCCTKLCPYTSVYYLPTYSLKLEYSMFHVINPKSILRPQGMQMCRSKPFHVTWSKIYFMCLYSHFITILI